MPSIWRGPRHIQVADPTIRLGLFITGVVASMCVGAGIVAIIWNATSPTTISLFGARISTGNVGVALVFIGLIVLGVIVREAFKLIRALAGIRDQAQIAREQREQRGKVDRV